MKASPERIKRFMELLVYANSENPPGHTTEVLKAVTRVCNENGLNLEALEYTKDKWVARITIEHDSSKPDFIIAAHMDVVPIGSKAKWEYNPLGEEQNGYYYGRGASDMKSGIATALETMIILKHKQSELSANLVILLTSDEETGMAGARYIQEKTNWMKKCKYLLIPEPTDLKVACGEKGVFWATMIVHGQAAHGSQPERGKNAILAAMKATMKIMENKPQEKDPILGDVTINVGMIQGGKSPNVVPDMCSVNFDIRTTQVFTNEHALKFLQDIVKGVSEETKCPIEIKVVQQLPAVSSNPMDPLPKLLNEKTQPLTGMAEPTTVTYGTDAAALIGDRSDVQFVIFGPGETMTMHQPNEKTRLKDIQIASEILAETIQKVLMN